MSSTNIKEIVEILPGGPRCSCGHPLHLGAVLKQPVGKKENTILPYWCLICDVAKR